MRKETTVSFGLSMIVHVLLLCLCFITFKFDKSSYRVPGVARPIESFVVVQAISHVAQPKRKIATHGLMVRRAQVVKTIKKQASSIPKNKTLSGKTLNQLVVLLYQAINQHKTYPDMAQQLGQTGVVQVGFKLDVAGTLSDIHVVHSCGFQDLDQAAVQAVQATGHVDGVNRYLHEPQVFVIPIQFAG